MFCAGMIEYWRVSDHQFPEQGVTFKYKMETDLFALAKAKTHAGSLAVSRDGTQFSVFCADKCASLAVRACSKCPWTVIQARPVCLASGQGLWVFCCSLET